MKKLLLIMIVASANTLLAQDIFQQKLYAPDLVLKYREEAGLSADQVEKIKNIYNSELAAYNSKKWDLDATMVKLEQLISQNNVDAKAANALLEKSLALETEIKKMKLAMLLKIKNLLTQAQQAKLDAHKSEFVSENSITASLSDNQRVSVRVKPGTDLKAKPLYIIIDGTEQKMTEDVPADLKPDDIESIQVLKGTSATNIYGKQGENGVIIIKVKKK
jgi:TonB-dependent SusC/RagA subfamily outer membrane receptor